MLGNSQTFDKLLPAEKVDWRLLGVSELCQVVFHGFRRAVDVGVVVYYATLEFLFPTTVLSVCWIVFQRTLLIALLHPLLVWLLT